MLNLRGYCSTGAQGGHASGVCGTDGGARGGTSVTGLVAAENAEDGRGVLVATTCVRAVSRLWPGELDQLVQAFYRTLGVRVLFLFYFYI